MAPPADEEIRDARGFGVTPDDVAVWRPFRALEIYWARKQGLPLEVARRWAEHGVPVRDTVMAWSLGLSLEEVDEWAANGFTPGDAWEARETGVGMPAAKAWREAGFIVPDALQLIRDGWDLEAAIAARYAGIDRYGVAGSGLPTRDDAD